MPHPILIACRALNSDIGLLGVYLTADPEGQTYMMNAVMREVWLRARFLCLLTCCSASQLVGLSVNVDAERLQEAKNALKVLLLSSLSSTNQVCSKSPSVAIFYFCRLLTAQTADEIGRQLLNLRRRLHPSEVVARIDAVDTNTIKVGIQSHASATCSFLPCCARESIQRAIRRTAVCRAAFLL